MAINTHTSAQPGSVLTRFTFFDKYNANVYSIFTVATCLISYIIFTIYEHNRHQMKYFSENIFSLFNFLLCKKNPLNFPNIRIYKNQVIVPS